MLCPTCPKRLICKKACNELEEDLKRLEFPMFSNLKSPKQIDKIVFSQYQPEKIDEMDNSEEELIDLQKVREKQRLLEILTEGIKGLAPGYQVCLRLLYWEDLSHRKIADRLGISHQAVTLRLKAAHEILRQHCLTESLTTACRSSYSRTVQFPNVAA